MKIDKTKQNKNKFTKTQSKTQKLKLKEYWNCLKSILLFTRTSSHQDIYSLDV